MVKLGLVSALLLAAAGMLDAQANGLLERGAYLVNHVAACGNCQSPLGPEGEIPGQAFSGCFVISTPGFDAFAPLLALMKPLPVKWEDQSQSPHAQRNLKGTSKRTAIIAQPAVEEPSRQTTAA